MKKNPLDFEINVPVNPTKVETKNGESVIKLDKETIDRIWEQRRDRIIENIRKNPFYYFSIPYVDFLDRDNNVCMSINVLDEAILSLTKYLSNVSNEEAKDVLSKIKYLKRNRLKAIRQAKAYDDRLCRIERIKQKPELYFKELMAEELIDIDYITAALDGYNRILDGDSSKKRKRKILKSRERVEDIRDQLLNIVERRKK